MIYPDGSSSENCRCDGSDDHSYTCDYHFENQDNADFYDHDRPHSYDLVDAYGSHYKSGVYDV